VIEHGFPVQDWLTFRQALSLGGNVRNGEHGTTVVYADRFIPDDEKKRAQETGEEAQAIPFLSRFTVFNLAQCEGLPENLVVAASPPEPGLIEPKVEALIKASGIDFRIGGSRAFYMPAQDYVQVPPPQAYFEPINWHRTALHELGHASGAPHRLNRDLSGSFGSRNYAFEELVAEMNAAFCCASLGIVPTVRHADYVGSWLEVLREDNRAIVRAASQASKAADFLLRFLPDNQQPDPGAPPAQTTRNPVTFHEAFRKIGEKKVGGGPKTTAADEFLFYGDLGSGPLILRSRVRLIDPKESFYTSSNHRLRDSHIGRSGYWIDIEVRGECSDNDLALIERLAREADSRPVVARRVARFRHRSGRREPR
jgi:antirestriction protein ArdC